MNNQQLENQRKEEADVTKRRRFLQKAGIAAPVILTFSSPTAFGGNALCMSQQLSGGVSNPTLSCNIGTYKPADIVPPNFPSGGTYDGNSNFSTVFGGGTNDTFGNILTSDPSSDESIFITALMNAQAAPGSYVLTVSQVLALYTNPANRPAGYGSAAAFLLSTFPA